MNTIKELMEQVGFINQLASQEPEYCSVCDNELPVSRDWKCQYSDDRGVWCDGCFDKYGRR